MAQFYFDADFLSEKEKSDLSRAVADFAAGDPLAVELVLVGEEQIRELNKTMRGIDRVTDVLSFPSMDDIFCRPVMASEHGEEIDEEGRIFLGSIVVCEKRAREQAEEYGHSYERELFYLIVHGVLHCLGYDHETEEDKAQMREKEEAAMKKLSLTRE